MADRGNPVKVKVGYENVTQRNAERPVNEDSVGINLYSSCRYIIDPLCGCEIMTGVKMTLPAGFYGRIAPCPGRAEAKFVDVYASVIEPGYKDEIKVVLFNFDKEPFEVAEGEKVAQLILDRIYTPALVEMES